MADASAMFTFSGTQIEVDLLPITIEFLALHESELPQKDDLCGAFWAVLALRALDSDGLSETPLDQESVAIAAGTTISPPPNLEPLPPGESGRRDYARAIPVADDSGLAGTSASGLIRAIAALSGNRLCALPLTGTWDADRVRVLLELAKGH